MYHIQHPARLTSNELPDLVIHVPSRAGDGEVRRVWRNSLHNFPLT